MMNTTTMIHELKNVTRYMEDVVKKCETIIGYDVKHTKLYVHGDRCLREADQFMGIYGHELEYKEKEVLRKLIDKLETLMYDFREYELI